MNIHGYRSRVHIGGFLWLNTVFMPQNSRNSFLVFNYCTGNGCYGKLLLRMLLYSRSTVRLITRGQPRITAQHWVAICPILVRTGHLCVLSWSVSITSRDYSSKVEIVIRNANEDHKLCLKSDFHG